MFKTSLDKADPFPAARGIHPSARLRACGVIPRSRPYLALEGQALQRKIADAHFIGVRSRTQLDGRLLAHAHKLVAISCFASAPTRWIWKAARERGIPVFNAPYSNTRSVAELVLARDPSCCCAACRANAVAHRGGWLKSADNAYEARGKTLGIVGYGAIGSQLSVLAESLGMQVVFRDVVGKAAAGQRAPGGRQLHAAGAKATS